MKNPKDQDTKRAFTRRSLILGAGQLGLVGALGARLYYLQVVEADRYRTLSEENQFNLELLPPTRGLILDRNGIEIASNEDNFRVDLVPEQTNDVRATIEALRQIVHVDEWNIKRVLKEVSRKRSFVPVTVVENLTREDISRVAVNAPYLPGVRIEEGRSRHYPFGSKAVNVTGYVAAVSDSELTGDPVLELPDFRIGKSGIEKLFDERMRGAAGRRQVEVNALGRIIRKLPGDDGQPGQNIQLTLDMDLQTYAHGRLEIGTSERVPIADIRVQEALARSGVPKRYLENEDGTVFLDKDGNIVPGESGGAVVMDVHTGEIHALASTPGFDPNNFNKGLSARDWEDLLSNPRHPLTNKAIAGTYPPGSTFKMIVALAALEAGVAGPETRVFCNGHMDLGNARFHCWKRWGHGHMDVITALEQSCDVYFYEVAKRVGIDRIAEMARRFGLGESLAIELPGERGGLIPTREWKLAVMGERWQKGETLVTGIGQGFVLTTPLQLAVMTARMVNGGYAVTPSLVRKPDGAIQEPPKVNVSRTHLSLVLEGMRRVVNGQRGTARTAKVPGADFEVGGKTGTSQVRRITKAERAAGVIDNEDLPWHRRDHGLFVGYAPVAAPRYAVAVVLEHGGGSKYAVPVARDILAKAMERDGLKSSEADPVSILPDGEQTERG
ncbi:penicillin-binding protein 2 [Nisaea sediminum]|uniref:penicillin-binding protein 2 n=1 Tax=Nisaea sediminum TaxID=2775867 RepID=UPI0018672AE5|nr:penicillin-binding protein 2 [Nisaea sediminum]